MFNTAAAPAPVFRGLLTALACVALAACGFHWPWRHRAVPPPPAVHELTIQPSGDTSATASGVTQFWDRNTLLLDLTAVAGDGAVTLTPTAHGWPVRLEFRVQPGSFARLEVQARERVLFEVPSQGKPVVLKLAPDAYVSETPQITLRWSVAGDSER
jgi:hypothetical protein